jgi:DNA-binding CsgD family transcriptional regulator
MMYDDIKKLLAEGLTQAEVARSVGCSSGYVSRVSRAAQETRMHQAGRETLASKIMALDDGKRTTRQIADELGTSIEYVRVVMRQRKGGGSSDIDRRYRSSRLGKATDDRRAQKHLAYQRTLAVTGDYSEARKAYREAK